MTEQRMYCRSCYCRLDATAEFPRCVYCDRAFNPSDPRTFLPRPFPGKSRIALHLIGGVIVSVVVAFVVSFFQLAAASGH
jgi:hypothetical protein